MIEIRKLKLFFPRYEGSDGTCPSVDLMTITKYYTNELPKNLIRAAPKLKRFRSRVRVG